MHPSTIDAETIAAKLYNEVSHHPPPWMIDLYAATLVPKIGFAKTGEEIKRTQKDFLESRNAIIAALATYRSHSD
ncbi:MULTISPECIES: hypothetical protein [Burkholderia]|uniref:Uncharacterized protein n=1 Tax=Burkholderia mayonis TaxID=1385591 RepID=A0A1B4FTN1_9BURK|nr:MULTISPECIES: hypothetical protein [Burkholderia]AOJ07034.1 hypothetical protein WS71_06720 [Burkholderia mayonis]KVD80792.1 hypothetical protein WS62_26085 [Burkholderia sp. ABCPW 14]KVE34503.1 hypothetical protein WS69_16475 [Burkholderia sp. BDU5]KVE45916.1 hypothetical protein WS71_22845 [Burkholderia mayonis]